MPIDTTDILHELNKPARFREPSFGPGPLPETYLIPAEHLDALLRDRERLERLAAFLRCGAVETSLCTHHDGNMSSEPEAEHDEDTWNTRRWVMGYSIETENRGCYRFQRLAEGRDFRTTLDAGLAAWDRDVARWTAVEANND